MGVHENRGRRRLGVRPAPTGLVTPVAPVTPAAPAAPVAPAGRAGATRTSGAQAQGRQRHPSRCLTVVHDGDDRVDTVSLWLAAPRAAHPGDQVGWPRGGLAPSGTYSIRLGCGGYLSIVGGTFVSWQDVPGPGPLLTRSGELDDQVPLTGAPNVVPLRRSVVPGPVNDFPGLGGPGGGATVPGLTCPCRNPGGLRLAGRQDEQRERDRTRREHATAQALAVAEGLLLAAVLDDGSPDVDALVGGIRAALAGELAVGPFAQRVAVGVPGQVMCDVLRRLLAERPADPTSPRTGPGVPAAAGTGSGHVDDADFRVAFRMLAQRVLAVHGAEVLDALPARFIADGMAAEALVTPRLERLLGRCLPNDLARLARWSLAGLDGTLGEVDPRAVEITLLAMGAALR